MSFAEDQSSGCGPSGSEAAAAAAAAAAEAAAEATGYATDDEAEGGRRLWGAALERARYSPARRDGTAHGAAHRPAHEAARRPAQRSHAHTVQVRVRVWVRVRVRVRVRVSLTLTNTVQEEGVAEALVLAACPSSAQVMPG